MALIELTSDDPRVDSARFKIYRNIAVRRVEQFNPGPSDAQTIEVETPWGDMLAVKPGDYVVSELDVPTDRWPVDKEIFESTYVQVGPGLYVKGPFTLLCPLTDFTGGDPDQMVIIHTLEGKETVRAGDFCLARGVKGEIWPFPVKKIGVALVETDQSPSQS